MGMLNNQMVICYECQPHLVPGSAAAHAHHICFIAPGQHWDLNIFNHIQHVAMSEWPASSTKKMQKKKIPSGYLKPWKITIYNR